MLEAFEADVDLKDVSRTLIHGITCELIYHANGSILKI